MSEYFVIDARFMFSSSRYSSCVAVSSPYRYVAVFVNMPVASRLRFGSCGSSASKLDVEVDSVGPKMVLLCKLCSREDVS